MAIKNLSIICRRMTALDKNLFSHQDMLYKFAGWAKTRDRANAGEVDFVDLEQLSVVNDAPELELYAVWKKRELIPTYKDLKITSSNVTYDKTVAPIFYTVTKIETYEGFDVPYSVLTIANDVAENSEPFEKNVTANLDAPTLSRTLQIKYKHPDSGLIATTTITQGGYTPIYKICIKATDFGTVQCYSKQKLLTSKTINGVTTYSSTDKNFTLKAVADVLTDTEWVSKSACAYYHKSYDIRLKHAAAYPKSNGCGSWKTITTKLYDFLSWSGGSVDGSTSATVTVQGSVDNPSTIYANFIKIPLLKNTIIGNWNETWKVAKTTTETYVATKQVKTWVPTCKTGKKYLALYGISTMHEGRTGHGYYNVTNLPYTATKTKTTYTTHKNKFYGASRVDAPYTLYIPTNGKIRIKGKYGTGVYGGAKDITQTGGFTILKYNPNTNIFDEYLPITGKASASNNYIIDLDLIFNVLKGDKLRFTKIMSKMALWIDSIELL